MTTDQKFEDWIRRLRDASTKWNDTAHMEADIVLREVALDTEMSKDQREAIVAVYDAIEKWYN